MHEFTKRAKSWLDEHEPGLDQIGSAYLNMNAKYDGLRANMDDAAIADAEDCLELLLDRYSNAGGDVDRLLAPTTKQPSAQVKDDYRFDPSPLVVADPDEHVPLTLQEKQAAIQRLKQILRSA